MLEPGLDDGGASLDRLLTESTVEVFFQEMISMSDQTLMGLEGFCRVHNGVKPIGADRAFAFSRTEEERSDLDGIFRQKVLEGFKSLANSIPEVALFLNFEASQLDEGGAGSIPILEDVERMGIDPGRVAIEVAESGVESADALIEFAKKIRRQGFLIALSGAGSVTSSIDRVFSLKPDVVKIDMEVVRGIDGSARKGEIFRGLAGMSHRVGALVVALGVEREEEAIRCLDLGADILQGFFFGLPFSAGTDVPERTGKRSAEIANRFKELRRDKSIIERARMHKYSRVADKIIPLLESYKWVDFDEAAAMIVRKNTGIQCVYILDDAGIQVTDTVFSKRPLAGKRKRIYRPAQKRADLSLKEYFMAVKNGQPRYVSRPYISLATGVRCVTLSTPFKDAMGIGYVLCIDFEAEASLDFEKNYIGAG